MFGGTGHEPAPDDARPEKRPRDSDAGPEDHAHPRKTTNMKVCILFHCLKRQVGRHCKHRRAGAKCVNLNSFEHCAQTTSPFACHAIGSMFALPQAHNAVDFAAEQPHVDPSSTGSTGQRHQELMSLFLQQAQLNQKIERLTKVRLRILLKGPASLCQGHVRLAWRQHGPGPAAASSPHAPR